MKRKSRRFSGPKKGAFLTKQEKWFIRTASRIETDKTASAIARELGRPNFTVSKLIRDEGLRSRKEAFDISKRALRKRHFPAHDMRPKIIGLLEETKKRQNRSLGDIAKKYKVSLSYVLRVNDEEKILSKKEIKELGAKIRAEKMKSRRHERLYQQARHLIRTTNLNFAEIARKLKANPRFVTTANRGRGEDEQIRSEQEIYEMAYRQKRIKHFSDKQKVELLEKLKNYIWTVLKSKKIPVSARNGIIDDVNQTLFKKLDYFDPKKDIPVKGFLAHFSKFYIGKAIGRSVKKAGFKLPTDKRGQPTIESANKRQPAEAVLTSQTIRAMNKFLDKRERQVLIGVSKGRAYKQIGKELDISATTVGKIRKKAIEKLKKALEK